MEKFRTFHKNVNPYFLLYDIVLLGMRSQASVYHALASTGLLMKWVSTTIAPHFLAKSSVQAPVCVGLPMQNIVDPLPDMRTCSKPRSCRSEKKATREPNRVNFDFTNNHVLRTYGAPCPIPKFQPIPFPLLVLFSCARTRQIQRRPVLQKRK